MGTGIKIVAIFLGGGLGSISRFAISKLVQNFSASVFPYATLLANFLACIVLVLGLNYLYLKDAENWLKYFLIIGFCGGFSTFSTFSLETFTLLKNQEYLFAFLNILLSVFLCLFVFWAFYKNIAQH